MKVEALNGVGRRTPVDADMPVTSGPEETDLADTSLSLHLLLVRTTSIAKPRATHHSILVKPLRLVSKAAPTIAPHAQGEFRPKRTKGSQIVNESDQPPGSASLAGEAMARGKQCLVCSAAMRLI